VLNVFLENAIRGSVTNAGAREEKDRHRHGRRLRFEAPVQDPGRVRRLDW